MTHERKLNPNIDLDALLAINVVQRDRVYHEERKTLVRQRFLAGLWQAVEDTPALDELFFFNQMASLTEDVRTLPSRTLYLNLKQCARRDMPQGITPEQARAAKEFYKRMATTRGALGTTRETREVMAALFPDNIQIKRDDVLRACKWALEHPDFVFTSEQVHAMQIETATEQVSGARRSPRI